MALDRGISVYSLGGGGGFFERKFSRLQSYAHDSGGDVFYAAKRNPLEELYSRDTEQARNQYTLGYNPKGNNKTKDYHTIEVRVRREGLSILTREGYYSVTSPRSQLHPFASVSQPVQPGSAAEVCAA
jgi:VWFA-related protein